MAAIKPLETSATKWAQRAAVAGEDYRAGINNPRTPWDQAAIAADANYRAGVTAAAQAGKFASGVRRAGADKWRQNAIAKGPSRFAEGVSLSTSEWQRGFGPFHQAIASLTLPARGPVGSPQNFERVRAIGNALRMRKDSTTTTR